MIWAVGDSITYGYYDVAVPNPLVDGYAARAAAALGLPISNTAYPGSTMLGIVATGQHSILDQMLALTPPNRYDVVLTMLGTNDLIAYGTSAPELATFSTGLRAGLMWLTSHRRVPDRQSRLDPSGQAPSVPDGCRVFVGNTPKQLVYSPPNGSAAAQAAYAAQVAADVAYVAGQGRRVTLVDVASTYDPATMSTDAPYYIHPNATGHVALRDVYLAAIRAHL